MTPGPLARWAALPILAVMADVPSIAGAIEDQGILEQIVVTVNGDVITKTDIDERLRVMGAPADAIAAGAGVDPALLTRVLRDAVDERLMTARAAELGLVVRDDDVDRVLATIRQESQVESEQAFSELLKREGMTLEILRATTRRQLLIEQVRQHLYRRLSVTNDEALRYFDAHRPELARHAAVTFREVRVVVPRPGAVPDRERDRAIVKVVAAGDRLAAGAEFDTVVREFSESASKASGGRVGPVDPEDLEPFVRSALAALRPGAISAPVETSEGYVFVILEGSEKAGAPTFHESRTWIVETLLTRKQRTALGDLLARLRGSAMLRWKRHDLQAAYERPAPYR